MQTETVSSDAQPMASSVSSDAKPSRQRRYLDGLAKAGVAQMNILAPVSAEAAIREIARRTKAGEPLSFVLDSVATKARLAGKPMDVADLAGLLADQPEPEPGHVMVAAKLTNAASGYDRKRLKLVGAGLAKIGGPRTGRGGAFVGQIAEASLDALRALVEKCGGRMEVRGQPVR